MRQRLDLLLVERGLAETRAQAQGLIRAGAVQVNRQVFDKPGMSVPADADIALRAPPPYVGRGGLKLAGALDAFGLDPGNRVCLDVGASTGGFTDVLLQRGARHVFAVDVGRGQLAWRLRADSRVSNLERTDVRRLAPLPEPITLAVVDVAFISLRLVLPAVLPHLAAGADVVALVKPQFEAGRRAVGRGGVVRDPAVRRQTLIELLSAVAAQGWILQGLAPSVIAGGDGNQEYFAWLRHAATPQDATDLADRVDQAIAG